MSFRSFLHLLPLLASLVLAAVPGPDKEFSIGATHPLTPDRKSIPNFHIHTPRGTPQLLSDRVILTPPAPGHQRTGLWSIHPVPYDDFTIDLSFRAHGQTKPGGSLTLWYTSKQTDAETVYDSRGWDGLAVVVDTVDGKGTIRAYLNDGKRDYANEKRPTSLAFGHCDVNYRNRGVLSKLTLSSGSGVVKVEIDGKVCFESKKTRLPNNYYLGVTASTLDPADSFELFSLITTSTQPRVTSPRDSHPDADRNSRDRLDQPIRGQANNERRDPLAHNPGDSATWEYRAEPGEEDRDASYYKTPEAQYKDLHDRLQGMTHHIAQLQYQLHMNWEAVEQTLKRQEETLKKQEEMIRQVQTHISKKDNPGYEMIKQKLQSIELLAIDTANAITHKDYSHDFARLRQQLEAQQRHVVDHVHERISHVVQSHRPKLGLFIVIVVAVQMALAGAYMWNKKRRNSSPKKYL